MNSFVGATLLNLSLDKRIWSLHVRLILAICRKMLTWAPVWKIRYCGHDEGSYDSTRSTRRFFVFHYGSFHPTSRSLFLFHRTYVRGSAFYVRVASSPQKILAVATSIASFSAWCIERNRIVLRLQLATLFQRSLPRFFLLLLIYSFFLFLSFMFYLYIYISFYLIFLSFVFFRFIISHLNVDK